MEVGTKSVVVTYFWWLVGGLFGFHHLYLRRDRQAFLWWSTLGGYFGLGWLADIYKIPRYVKEANNDPRYVEDLIKRMKESRTPPFSMNRFVGGVSIGYFWGSLITMAIPEDEFGGVDWRFLHWLVPAAITLGVWIVGNMGHERGSIWLTLATCYVSYPVITSYVYDDSYALTGVTLVGSLAFDTFSKEWRRTPRARKSTGHRLATLSFCVTAYLALWASYFYFNGKVTDSEGNEVPVYEAIRHFLKSPWWTDLKQSLVDVWNYAQHHGWYEVWKQIIDLGDPTGEQNSYKVLGIGVHATQAEITAAWRRLSRESHPDKQKDPALQRQAQERFMEIQQAYEILSKSKTRRKQKNKKSNTD